MEIVALSIDFWILNTIWLRFNLSVWLPSSDSPLTHLTETRISSISTNHFASLFILYSTSLSFFKNKKKMLFWVKITFSLYYPHHHHRLCYHLFMFPLLFPLICSLAPPADNDITHRLYYYAWQSRVRLTSDSRRTRDATALGNV